MVVARTERPRDKAESKRVDTYMKVFSCTIKNAIHQQLDLVLGSCLKRALRPSADEAELAVIVAPLQPKSFAQFDVRFEAMFAEEHKELVIKYTDQAQKIVLTLKTFLSRSAGASDLHNVMSQFHVLDEQCKEFGVDVEETAGLKQKISKRAEECLTLCVASRRAKILSLARLEKQASSQPMVVAENMCLEVQKLRKVLGVQTTEDALGGADFTVMKALAVISQCASSDTTPSDLERCRSVLADAEDVLTEPSRRSDLDLVTSLGLVDVAEISEIRQAIERGLAASKEAQLEERERRLTKLKPCKVAAEITAILSEIPLPTSDATSAEFRSAIIPVSKKIVQKQQKIVADLEANADMRDDMKESRQKAVHMAKQYLFAFAVSANADMFKMSKVGSKGRRDFATELSTLDTQQKDVCACVRVCAWCSTVVSLAIIW